jgi:ribosomal protein S12 methylthiotransferase accessory factor
MTKLQNLLPYFEQLRMSPQTWPVTVAAVLAGDRARQVWPAFPAAAEPGQGRLGHGAGSDMAAAIRRATGEMIEIASCCAWGDEQLVAASIAEVGTDGWSPEVLSGFSNEQRMDRDTWNRRFDGLDWIPPVPDPESRIDWLRAECLHGGHPVLVPADCVLIGRRTNGDAAGVAVADTNGCAAGGSVDGALLSALYELIERDATGRWWYGQSKYRVLAPEAEGVDARVLSHMQGRARVLRLFEITSDIGVPTVASLGTDPDGTHIAAGFATRADIAAAVQAAVTELMQMELKIAFVRSSGNPDPGLLAWFNQVWTEGPETEERHTGCKARDEGITADSIALCLSRLASCGIRVARLDCSRAEFGVPVIRAISPDLCHWKPRFGRSRLLFTADGDDAVESRVQLLRNWPLLRI